MIHIIINHIKIVFCRQMHLTIYWKHTRIIYQRYLLCFLSAPEISVSREINKFAVGSKVHKMMLWRFAHQRTSPRKTTHHCENCLSAHNNETEREGRGGRLDDEGQCQILPTRLTTPLERKDGEKDERRANGCTVKVLSPIHIVTVRADERDGERNRKKRNKTLEDGTSRDDVENFSRTFPDAAAISLGERNRQKKRAREANASSRTKLRPSGKWNAGELEKFKCARLWRCLRKSPLLLFAPCKVASAILSPSLRSGDGERIFCLRIVIWIAPQSGYLWLWNQLSRICYNLEELNA